MAGVTSDERVNLALHHKETDFILLDLRASAVTGMQVDTVCCASGARL